MTTTYSVLFFTFGLVGTIAFMSNTSTLGPKINTTFHFPVSYCAKCRPVRLAMYEDVVLQYFCSDTYYVLHSPVPLT